jgi:uncharacterized protein with NAD-binding domain and iron-sulfur cluster
LPAVCKAYRMSKRVAVFGAGIAGLTVAHELIRRGYRVAVYEANSQAGGFFRSARRPADNGMPSEYSWHGMGPWYHNVFDLMQQIPFDSTHTVYERALSRPIDFGIFPDQGAARFYDQGPWSIPAMFRMSPLDFVGWAYVMLKSWTANRRSRTRYAALNAAAAWKKVMSDLSYRTWRSCFGPWIGSDWTLVSLHTAGLFFRNQLLSWPPHAHAADDHGPAWTHGAGDGWLLLAGPSSEYWFTPWVRHLQASGVEFFFNESLLQLEAAEGEIRAAYLESGPKVDADIYVLATHPFAVAKLVASSPELANDSELGKFSGLVQDGPHSQVSFRIGFSEPIAFPRERTAVVLADTEFNLTLFAQEQAWDSHVALGENIQSLWTVTSCVGSVPGRIHKIPVMFCTEQQYLEEVVEQVLACGSLDALVREANHGRGIRDFAIEKVVVWHEWTFSPDGIRPEQPKWVTTTHTEPFRPKQVTSFPNLLLAGAHTQTTVDVWSIEGAVESGRLAVRALEPAVPVLSQHRPVWLRLLGAVDDVFFAMGAPHVLDLALAAGLLWIVLRAV